MRGMEAERESKTRGGAMKPAWRFRGAGRAGMGRAAAGRFADGFMIRIGAGLFRSVLPLKGLPLLKGFRAGQARRVLLVLLFAAAPAGR